MANLCPVCGKDDQSLNLCHIASQQPLYQSARMRGWTFNGSGIGIVRASVPSQQTVLMDLLKPPDEPTKNHSIVDTLFAVCLLSTIVLLFLFAQAPIPHLTFITFVAGGIELVSWIAYNEWNRSKVGTLHKEWERQILVWSELYYCARDFIVYDPKTGRTCNPANLESLLH